MATEWLGWALSVWAAVSLTGAWAQEAEASPSLAAPEGRGPSWALTEHLLSRHNPAAPPDGRVALEFEMELVNVLEVDEVGQSISVLVYVEERWVDASLSWEPRDFANLSTTWLPEDAIWLPDIIVFNMLRHENLLHSVRAPVMIRSSGQVTYTFPAIYTVMCSIDVSMFPLDSQHCALEISSWEYEEDKLVLHPTTEHALDHYQPNEEWELVAVAVNKTHFTHEGITVSELLFDVHIRRRPFFYMISLVTPSCIITVLSITGLFAPFSSTGERQEKFTLGVTAILTMAVLSLMVSEKVPHTSKDVPLLMGYFMSEMILIAVASILTSFIMRVHRRGVRGDPPPPPWLRGLLCLGGGRGRKASGALLRNGEAQREGGAEAGEASEATLRLVKDIGASLGAIEARLGGLAGLAGGERAGMVRSQLIGTEPLWIQAAARLDLLALAFFIGFVGVLTARITIMEAGFHEALHHA